MIGRLRGIVLEKQPPEVLLEANGVGYEVHMPMTCFYELPDVGQEAIIFTHFVVREDAQLLYGLKSMALGQNWRWPFCPACQLSSLLPPSNVKKLARW